MDDRLIELIKQAFTECRLYEVQVLQTDFINSPNFHREEELVKQICNLKIPAIFTECGVGEKMNKECKKPFKRKFDIAWVMDQLTLQRYILEQVRRNNYVQKEPFVSIGDESLNEIYYYTKGKEKISSIYFTTWSQKNFREFY